MWLTLFTLCFVLTLSHPEAGHYIERFQRINRQKFIKTITHEATKSIKVVCNSEETVDLKIMEVFSKCANGFNSINDNNINKIYLEGRTNDTDYSLYKDSYTVHCNQEVTLKQKDKTEGAYLLTLDVGPCKTSSFCPEEFEVEVEIKEPAGFLSPIDRPLKDSYLFFGILDLLLLLPYFVMLVYYKTEILRVQLCIAGLIFATFVESFAFFGTLHTMDSTGSLIMSTIYFLCVVTTFRRSIGRLLMLFVCLGFGTTKASVGKTSLKVYSLVVCYFIFSLIGRIVKERYPPFTPSKTYFGFIFISTLIDVAIIWLCMTDLIKTMKEVSQKNNIVKYQLYRKFIAVISFVSILSLVYMVFVIILIRRNDCFVHWRILSTDEIFWNVLFQFVLMFIMYLWRPGKIQYAYSIFIDPEAYYKESAENDTRVIIPEEETEGAEMQVTNLKKKRDNPA